METNDHQRGETTPTTKTGQHFGDKAAGAHAGTFLRARFSQWVMRAGSRQVNLMPERETAAPSEAKAPETTAHATNEQVAGKPDSATASRNAQNCTFEVF